MLLYGQYPVSYHFTDWVDIEMSRKRGWPIKLVKFTGKNFFLVLFDNPTHRDRALLTAPWFMDRSFVYTFPWELGFDVRVESFTMLPVWIEIPYRSLILEGCKHRLVASLGQVLYFVKGNERSKYPHNRFCILWDTHKDIPHSIKVQVKQCMAEEISIWQPVIFKTSPLHCLRFPNMSHIHQAEVPSCAAEVLIGLATPSQGS